MENKIGLTEKEKRVLSALFKLGGGGAQEIAKETLINRTTLYPILNKLGQKGLLSQIKMEDKVIFQPLDLQELGQWFLRQEKEIKEERVAILSWLKAQKPSRKANLFSEIKYFEGPEGIRSLYADSWRNNPQKVIYALTDYQKAYETLGKFFREEYLPARVKHGVRAKSLLPVSPDGIRDIKTAKQLLKEMRFVDIFKDLGIELNIYDSKISLVAFDAKNPTGVLIKNEKLAAAFKHIFDYLWKTSQAPKEITG